MPGNYIFNYEYTFNYELYYSGLITDWDLIQLFYYSFFLTFSDHPREIHTSPRKSRVLQNTFSQKRHSSRGTATVSRSATRENVYKEMK